LKRLLYVACTRARRELHLLGTATMSASGLRGGDKKSLLEVGWPAFEAKFQEAAMKQSTPKVVDFPMAQAKQGDLFDLFNLAAVAENKSPLKLKRLASLEGVRPRGKNVTVAGTNLRDAETELVRPEGSRRARVIGSAVHALLDRLSRGLDPSALQEQARSLLRTAAFSGRALDEAMQEVMSAVENCRSDAVGRWILEPHPGAQSETSWTGWIKDEMVTLRADRVFRGGPSPMDGGSEYQWIVDYKMSAPAGEVVEEFIAKQREVYAPQLERYAEALRLLEGRESLVRMGLYYPRIGRLDWWGE
jgi:ATP-dependent helicase/nuclease subunit A